MPPALRCVLALVALALSSVLLPLSIVADRFSPAITPTHLTSVNGISRNAMLITRTSIPPGMDPADVTLTAEQLADENAAWACISPTAAPGNTMPLAFIVTRVAEIALANLDWAQSSPPFFALRYFNGSVQVYQATGTVTTNGVAEFSAPYWLSGVYSEMTTGEAHICALTTDQRVQCITTTLSFPAPTALMATRSAVAYTQIAAASRFTCGLRALDQLVECCGAVGRDVNALTAVNYTSTLRYASIAARFDSGFCGVVADTGELACYSVQATGVPEIVVLPAPTLPVTFAFPLWLYDSVLPVTQACAMRNDGAIECIHSLPVGASLLRPMSQATFVSSLVMGATTDNGQLQQTQQTVGWVSSPTVSLFEALRFIAVDSAEGNDTACTAVRAQFPSEMLNFIPCASLSQALALVTHPHTWIQLLPGTHTVAACLTLDHSEMTIASAPPSCFTTSELSLLGNGSWVTRMQAATVTGQSVTIDCTGSPNCFFTMQSRLQLIGLTFTGSTRHAIVSLSDNSTDTNSRLPPSTLAIENCVFNEMGGVLLKTKGSATITGCTITNSLQWANTTLGLIALTDASLVMTGTNFSHNHLPIADSALRSCLRSVSTLPVTLSIADSHWFNNSASTATPYSLARMPGGVALQIQAHGPLMLTVVDSSFVEQHLGCEDCDGGAVTVLTDRGDPSIIAQVIFRRDVWSQNTNLPADVTADPYTFGGCLAIGEIDQSGFVLSDATLFTAADVIIDRCSFSASQAKFGGCLSLGAMKSLQVTDSSFDQCSGDFGGAVFMTNRPGVPLGFSPREYAMTRLSVTRCFAADTGGGFGFEGVRTLVNFDQLVVNDTRANVAGGAMALLSCVPEVHLTNSHFSNTTASDGGAISTVSTLVTGFDSTFQHIYALSKGGVVVAKNSQVQFHTCSFDHIGLQYQDRDIDPAKVIDRVGGVVSATGGSVIMDRCAFNQASALPNDLQITSCAKYYDVGAGLGSIGLGGIVSVEFSEIYLIDPTVTDATSCTGGMIYARSSFVYMFLGSYSFVRAHSGGLAAVVASPPISIFGIFRTHAISAVAAGGAFVLNECPAVTVQYNTMSGITVTNGDGGLMWIYALRRPVVTFSGNSVTDVTAPAGAGAVIFVRSAPNAFLPLDPIDDPSLTNQFDNHTGHAPPSLYGPLMATGVSTLSALQSDLTVAAGALLSTPILPLQITALDAFGQVIQQDRGLVVQVSCSSVEFRGTVLRTFHATDGSALFDDLRVIAAPGNYTLVFSIVAASQVRIALNLSVTDECPAASFYSISDRSCIPCGSNVLVYNATANACERCPAGWQRVAANDTSGALRDGVSCAVCPLGQVSAAGGLCSPCGPNTYQPVQLSECVSCGSVDGLNCVGNGLAQVKAGFFAMAIGAGTQQRIQTFPCPVSFCSAAQVQDAAAAGNAFSSSAVNSFSQCAFPRLASPTNLLCGECTEGYRPWGNKCSRCDSTNGGLMVLVIVLSFGLCFWLVRSALVTESAGHAVVIVYFVQTVMLELGTINRLLSWLNFTLFSPNSTTDCIGPLTPYQQVQSQVLMPVVLEIELIAVALMHWAAFKRWGTLAASEPTPSAKAPLSVRVRYALLRFVSLFSLDVYVNATLSLMLFSYTQVCAACVNYMQCVDVGGVAKVVFNQPAMHCDTDDYRHTRGLVLATLILYVAGFPAGIALFLIAKRKQLRDAYTFIDQRLAAEASGSQPASDSTPAARFVARYSPLFAMYSSSTSFWQLFVVSRRICFVAIAVLLVRDPQQRFMAFVLAHVVSLLFELIARPFRLQLLNAADVVAHLLLIVISATLSAHSSPDESGGIDVFVFLLVVPPLALYPLVVLLEHWREKRRERKTHGVELAAWSPRRSSDSANDKSIEPNPAVVAAEVASISSSRSPHASQSASAVLACPSTVTSPSAAGAVASADVLLSLPSHAPPSSRSPSPPAPLTRTFSVLSGPRRTHMQAGAAPMPPHAQPTRGVMSRGQTRKQLLAGFMESLQDVQLAQATTPGGAGTQVEL